MCQLGNTSFIGISSPQGANNTFSKWVEKLEPGRPDETFFTVVKCERVCADCRKLDRTQQLQCDHVKQTAHWIDDENTKRIKCLMEDDEATALRELTGVIEDDLIPVFNREIIQRMFMLPPFRADLERPKTICIAVDPNGGGSNSSLGIMSGYFTSNSIFVVNTHNIQLFIYFVVFVNNCRNV